MQDFEYEFEWHAEKAASNIIDHKVSFALAARIFEYERIEWLDDRFFYSEERYISLGRVEAVVYRVWYTYKSESLIHVIGAMKASRN